MGIRHHLHREYQIIDPNNPSGNVSIIEITDIPTAETTTTKVLAPDGAGGVEFRAEAGGGGGGALVLLEQHTASSSATLDFTAFASSTYDTYQIEIVNLLPATSSHVLMLVSTDAGSSWDTGANYGWSGYRVNSYGPSGNYNNGQTAAQVDLEGGGAPYISNDAGYGGLSASLRLVNPLSATSRKVFFGNVGAYQPSDLTPSLSMVAIFYNSITAVDGLRFLMGSGNIASGTIRVYGIAK